MNENNAIRIRDEKLFDDIKIASIKEGYKKMEDYIRMLHINRKIYVKELGKHAK